MSGGSDVEFLGADGRVLGSDEELALGARRRGGPWARRLAALLLVVAAGIGVAIAMVKQPDRRPVITPTPATAQLPNQPLLDSGAQTIALPSRARIVDVQIASGRVYVLQSDRLSVFAGASLHLVRSRALDGPQLLPSEYQVVLDSTGELGWIVSTDGLSSGRILAFDAKTLEIETTLTMTALVEDAAAIGDTLYVTTGAGLYDVVGFGDRARLVHPLPGARMVAADAVHDELFVLTDRPRPVLTALAPTGHVIASTALTVTDADVAVTGATVWLTGDVAQGAVVRTIDPRTLRQSADLDIATELGASATIVAAGTRSVWLRDEFDASGRVWCRNAAPGPDGPSWTTNATVRSASGLALVTDGTTLRTLPLVAGCAG
jgi:hypothetical protein